MPIQTTCKLCAAVTTYSSQWNLTRRKYPDLCKSCSNKCKVVATGPKQAKDWRAVYHDDTVTAATLAEAKLAGLPYYKAVCKEHGNVPYATLDNTCRICTRERAKRRNTANPEFNRPRIILASIKQRALARGIPFDLTIADIRDNTPTHCPVLGIELSFDEDTDTSPSVDRLVPELGYIRTNIRIISNRANRIKSDGTAEEHRLVSEWMCNELNKL